MPKLGAYTEDVLLMEWLVPEGVEVQAGDVLFALETDKTTAEVEAEAPGWLHRTVEAGQKVAIGVRVGVVATTREEYEALCVDGGEPANPFLGYIGQGGGAAAVQRSSAAPAARSRADAPLISPRARALLARRGLPLAVAREITGSGPGGRILGGDVAAWVEGRAETAAPGEPAVASRIPLRGRRGTIAARMVSSLQSAAQLTSVLELDVSPLVDLRRQLNEAGTSPRIGVTAIVVKLVAAALRNHPVLNSRIVGDEIEVLAEVNVAVAVDTPDGVVAPVVQGADRLPLEEINARLADLAARARGGSLTTADVSGGTFTVSNGGIYPVDITTAILNPPQCGILWIGRIRERPVVVDGTIAVRPTLQACLTYDHRAVDGGPAAEFLAALEALVTALPRLPA